MKIVVLIKEVPDTFGDRALNLETGLTERSAGERVIDEIDERALEVALAYAETNPGTEVGALSMAPAEATASIRKALAMGADSAEHLVGDALIGADLGVTAEVLAAALRRSGFDLVITGNVSTDGGSGMLPAMLAELLGVPNVTSLSTVTLTEETVSGTRLSDECTMQVSAPLPAVISVTEQLPDPRFPNFKGMMAAKKKPLTVTPIEELGVAVEDLTVPRAIMLAVAERPPREAGTKIVDEGDAAAKLAAYLVENHLV